MAASWNPSSDSPPPISLTSDQLKHCKEALASFKTRKLEKKEEEFKRLEANAITLKELKRRSTVALNDVNLHKNRYPDDFLPFDDNRVVLKSSSEGYINASFLSISSSESVSKFIATQGPLQHTCEDFWEMVIQQRCPVIVNLNELLESNNKKSEKCDDYFQAAEDKPKEFGNISVVCKLWKTVENSLVLRHLDVYRKVKDDKKEKKENGPFSVLHIHYSKWPVNGVPRNTLAVRAIFKRLHLKPQKLGPIVVHCGAGIGRTGAYCAVHNTIQRILVGEKSVWNLHNTLLVFRSQRYGLVQRQNQYNFCYEAIVDALEELVSSHNPWNPSPDPPPSISLTADQLRHCNEALASFRGATTEMIKKEFQRLQANKISDNDMKRRCAVALDAVNLPKNRTPDVLPFDDTRVVLKSSSYYRPTGKGYINASSLSISESVSKFIATQGPLPHTCEDFWEMVIQHGCHFIVNLTELVDFKKIVKCEDYFQAAEDKPKEFGNISVVCKLLKTVENSLVLRHLDVYRKVKDDKKEKKENGPFSVLHIHYSKWPINGVPHDTLAVRAIFKRLHHLPPGLGPIVVHSSSGIGRIGAYCAVHNTIQGILFGEKSAWDLHNTLLVFRSQRYGLVGQSQYNFCYKAIVDALEELVSSHNPWNPTPDPPPPISLTADQLKHCNEARARFREVKTEKINQEFARLEANKISDNDMKRRCAVALDALNLPKNRSPDVLPFDDTRVFLESSSYYRPTGKGYINASFLSISPSESVSKFIATQGPLLHTREDFWEMVIQYRCPVIVNLTALVDSKKSVKCEDYFQAAEDKPKEFGNISVVCKLWKTVENSLVLRHLDVYRKVKDDKKEKKENGPFSVLHIHYSKWPVNDVPQDTLAVHAIFKRLHHLPPELGPIVVHCRSGIGRTGAYCAIHNTIQRILVGEKSAWDLHNTLLVFRSQRYDLVPRQELYNFCYKAIIKALDELVKQHRQ